MDLNIEALGKAQLFKRSYDYITFAFLLLLIVTFSLLKSYEDYLSLKRFTWHTHKALILSEHAFSKQSQTQIRYKLKTDRFTFFTTSREHMRTLEGRYVNVAIYTNNIGFIEYLKGFYAPSKFLGLEYNQSFRSQLFTKIKANHDNPMIANLYGALYFAQSIDTKLRQKLTDLGINHLAAISGFHLGFISFFILLFFNFTFKPLYQRYLPFRNRSKDMMIVTLFFLFSYLFFLDFVPSLLRAFAMLFMGFIFFDRGVKLISFSSLSVTVLLLLSLFPALVFSLGFWLSVLGVSMIFLILEHFSHLKKWQLFFLLQWLVFILMMPWIVFIFTKFSLGQLLSPLISIVFIAFYPLSILLMSLGWADSLDSILVWLFTWDFKSTVLAISPLFIFFYSGLLFMSIWSQRLFTVTVAFAHIFLIFIWLIKP